MNASTGEHVWNYTTGSYVWSSPAVTDGKVYVGSNDRKVYCLNSSTGTHIWNYTTGSRVYSSPAVAYGNVYIGSTDTKVYAFGPSTHDVAITNVTLSKTIVGQGHSMSINITVENQGGFTETFNVTAYANATEIEKAEITLTSGSSKTLTIPQNTRDVAKGNYTIKAKATPLPSETDTTDNTLTDGVIQIVIPGDINADGTCNMKDIYQLIRHYTCSQGQPCYVPNYDINCDGTTNMKDIYIAIRHYGETHP